MSLHRMISVGMTARCRQSRRPHLVCARLALAAGAALAAFAVSAPPALASGDVNNATCAGFPGTEASPGFRAFMPDCRAYELVTPPYIGGQVPYGRSTINTRRPYISADGEHLLGVVFAGFAGTENEEQTGFVYGAIYEFSRTATGWSAESLEPPASQYARASMAAIASPSLDKTLWELTPSQGGEEVPSVIVNTNEVVLAVREQAGDGHGRFVPIGPMAAPGHELASTSSSPVGAVGASAELTHVLFRVRAEDKQLWPGDETLPGDYSLYEYRGTGESEPVLVGVKNDGPLHGTPHVNEGAELVSDCGTVLGSSEIATTYNAVSASGEVVYFTALGCPGGPPVNELYARVKGSSTVPISEPTTGPEGSCESCNESAPKAAVFEGASEDGSKVFFLSEQELLPGAEGETLYEYDFHAADEHQRVTLIAPDVTAVTTPSEEGGRVYFQSIAKLPTGPNANGEEPQQGASNLYMYEAATETTPRRVAYVARDTGVVDTGRDGQFAVFKSRAGEGTEGEGPGKEYAVEQLFEYDADTGMVARVSVGQASPEGYECEATKIVEERYGCDGITMNEEYAPLMMAPAGFASDSPAEVTSKLSVSRDGDVAFVSEDALTPGAVAGGENVYEYRAGDVYLISPGDEASPIHPENIHSEHAIGESRLEGIDESGVNIFFRSTESLVPQDVDTQASFYDAREDGGFPAPVSTPSCAGEACAGPLSPPPPLAVPGSSTLTAFGNLAAPVSKPESQSKAKGKASGSRGDKCAKGKKTSHRKCSKGKRKKEKAKGKKTSGDRRASR